MSLRFYIGEDEHEIKPEEKPENPSAYYAWCLYGLLKGLDHAKSDESKLAVIGEFENNMKLSRHTNEMMAQIEGLLANMKLQRPLPDNDTIINFLKGLPVGDEKYYIGYTKKI